MGIKTKLTCTAICILFAGCQQQEASENTSAVKLPVYQSNGLSASARLKGILQLKQECLYVNDILIIFPEHAAQWDSEKGALSYKGKHIELGRELDIAGGFGNFKQDNLRIKHLSPMCDHQNIWFAA